MRLSYFIFLLLLLSSCSQKSNVKVGEVKKWVAVGNSITWHPINDNWYCEHGMAATSPENDYVHVLNKMLINKLGSDVSFNIAWAVDWESNHDGYDLTYFDSFFDGDEDLILIRLGENVTSLTNYESDFRKLIKYLKQLSPNASILVTGIFMSESKYLLEKEAIQKKVSLSEGCMWIPINQLDSESNRSSVGTLVVGSDGNSHKISNQTVANHPGDTGMKKIAETIYHAIY